MRAGDGAALATVVIGGLSVGDEALTVGAAVADEALRWESPPAARGSSHELAGGPG
jgi:hypothetical protein